MTDILAPTSTGSTSTAEKVKVRVSLDVRAVQAHEVHVCFAPGSTPATRASRVHTAVSHSSVCH